MALGATALLAVAGGLLLSWRGTLDSPLETKGRYIVVAGAWILACLLGTVPYLVSGVTSGVVDAIFESVSGFTTTGASIMLNLEQIPRGIMLWRSMTNWLGGLGTLVTFILFLPNMGIETAALFNSEDPDLSSRKFSSKIKEKMVLLGKIYGALTLLEVIALLLAGMPAFDAVNHALTTISTGGFSTGSQSVAVYGSAAIEAVIIIFMLLGGLNFTIYMSFFQKKGRNILRNTEVQAYLLIALGATALTAADQVLHSGQQIGLAGRQAAFQVVALMTTTGYTSADYGLWSNFAKCVLFGLMFIGGCSLSPAGGIKVSRFIVLVKMAAINVRKAIHPQQIPNVRIGGQSVSDTILSSVSQFFFLFMSLFAGASLLLTITGIAPFEAMGAAVAALGNIGPAFGEFGPNMGYAAAHPVAKMTLAACMLFGRLEIVMLLVLLTPDFWKGRKIW